MDQVGFVSARRGKAGRATLAALLALLVVGLLAPPAAAAPPLRESYRFLFLQCSGTAADGGPVALTVGVARFDVAVDVLRWAPGTEPFEGPTVVGNDPRAPLTAFSWEGDEITGSTPVFATATGKPLGEATFSVTAVPGDAASFDNRNRVGNSLVRQRGSEFSLTASGTVTFPGGEVVALTDCSANGGENTLFQNNPRAALVPIEMAQARCDITVGDRRLLLVADGEGVSVAEYPAGADPETDRALRFAVNDEDSFSRRSLAATLPAFEIVDDEAVYVGDAVVQATLVRAGVPSTTMIRFPDGSKLRERIEPLTLRGTLTWPDGDVYRLDSCEAQRVGLLFHTLQPK